ncbi:phosphatase PAP2 family protein [Niveibacterium sp.]|uniref:phosphatase PAP2 family protein n=1 Tax=Niveibacterium sp. TaxID=2017444 RepID=UPI0035B252CD
MPESDAPEAPTKLLRPLLIWLPPAVLLGAALWLLHVDANVPVFIALNATAQRLPEHFWSWATALGTGACAYALIAPTLSRQPRLMAAALLTGAFGGIFTHTIKPLLNAARPAAKLTADQIHVIGDTLTRNSFPSGHAMTAFAFAATLVFFSQRPGRLALALLPLAAVVALSRIAVGAHWPLDVLVGAAGGWLSGVAGEAVSRRWLIWQRPAMQAVMAFALVVMGASLAFTNLGYPQADLLKWALSALAFFSGIVALRQQWIQRASS